MNIKKVAVRILLRTYPTGGDLKWWMFWSPQAGYIGLLFGFVLVTLSILLGSGYPFLLALVTLLLDITAQYLRGLTHEN